MTRTVTSIAVLLNVLVWAVIPVLGQDAVECGPSNDNVKIELRDKDKPHPKPSPEKAMVYFMQTNPGDIYQTKVAVNAQWVGAMKYDSYFFIDAAPGLLRICVTKRAKNSKFLYLTVDAGKTYYLIVGGTTITELMEEQALNALNKKKFRYSASRIESKGK